MATFVKGDFVQVTPRIDWKWEQWSYEHSKFCEKTCKVVDTNHEQWTDQFFIEVEYRGKRLWFLDRHLIKIDSYEEIFQESIHRACEELQRHEAICKRLRDEILDGAFNPDSPAPKATEEEEDSIFDDWQEVTTKEVIPLPGNGGTMTTIPDPKATANSNRNKVRKMKSLGKRIQKKGSQKVSGSLSGSWTLTEEELNDLQEYIDSLPNLDSSSSSRDYDYDYDVWDNDWDYGGDGNGD